MRPRRSHSPIKTKPNEYDRQIDIARNASRKLCPENPMEDLRNAKDTVALFADHIDQLRLKTDRPKSSELLRTISSSSVQRHGSNNSSSDGSTHKSSSLKWGKNRSVGKEWAGSRTGSIWTTLSSELEDVAKQFPGLSVAAFNEFIGSREILELGADFVRAYHKRGIALEKPYWAAEDLFFDLQAVKQGDAPASRWTQARPERRAEWDLADHIARFVLVADGFRRRSVEREDWSVWAGDFVTNVRFYLRVLRCFIKRDAKQREERRDAIRNQMQNQGQNKDAEGLEKKNSSGSRGSRFSLGSRGGSNKS
ncbi:uncharacterized protein F4807DRAFT_424104 [Annulohypoxylon truncatum]|uniref:uncharacterized protein n=1 Tax=Annulohypoxylon truncatum TaxID=327061 RepID=UPI00200839BE|nr:uncharacterized protein F4807DRAFT_424104 [Annulohypoxylon truncatum]KAI1210171.1 hypothetical protein F4807DRAFT_424104 [Annulohypoxylon truncatum]